MKNSHPPQEKIYQGLAVAPGIAIGEVYIHEAGVSSVPEYCIPSNQIQAECARFVEAAASAGREVAGLQAKAKRMKGAAGEELGFLLDAYEQMLKGSRLIRGVERRIIEERMNAEAAVQKEIGQMVEAFAAMDDAYLAARIEDVREVGMRLVRALTKTQYRPFSGLPKNAVIIADELTPADAALIDPKRAKGFATILGARESHTTIMARSLGLAAVVGVPHMLHRVQPKTPVIVDGASGKVIINPTPETLADYRERLAALLKDQRSLSRLRRTPAVTRDGTRIALQANVELPLESDTARTAGAEGVGLLRSEFIYMNRPDLPSEDEQYESYRLVVEKMDGRPVTIRTFDLGGDKMGDAVGCVLGPNPALGLRAIRLSLTQPKLMNTQLAAILRAGAHGPVRILVPMVMTVKEVRSVKAALLRTAKRLKRKGVPIADPLPPVGIMIEVPGAALAAEILAMEADFFALGTNDLTQYTLAIDRADEQVSDLYDPLHPGVLRLIQMTVDAALTARIPISICGEMAGDERYTSLLLGMGIQELSMSPTSIAKVKRRIRSMDLAAARRNTREILRESDSKRISQLLDEFDS